MSEIYTSFYDGYVRKQVTLNKIIDLKKNLNFFEISLNCCLEKKKQSFFIVISMILQLLHIKKYFTKKNYRFVLKWLLYQE